MNGFILKLIAIITMLIDHITAVLVPRNTIGYLIGRSIGRLAFPIFCFLLVEGLKHTKDVRNYLIRLGIFALISEVPFDLAFSQSPLLQHLFDHQNVFFTLFIGLLVIYYISVIEKKYSNQRQIGTLLEGLIVIAGCAVAMFLKTDYSYIGILIIVSFYLFRTNFFGLTLAIFILNYNWGFPQTLAVISMVFIWFYNGKRGPKFNRYIFYAFYPVHILCIYLISILLPKL